MTFHRDGNMHCHLCIWQSTVMQTKHVTWIISIRAAKRPAAQNMTIPFPTYPEAVGAARAQPWSTRCPGLRHVSGRLRSAPLQRGGAVEAGRQAPARPGGAAA